MSGRLLCVLVFFAGFMLAGCGGDRLLGPDGSLAVGTSSSLAASATVAGRIDLAWQDNATSETGWEVHRSSDGATGTFSQIGTLLGNNQSYTDVNVDPQTTYCYRVRSFRLTGSKRHLAAYSNTACATSLGPPPAVASVTATPAGSSVVDLLWQYQSDQESGFRIERSATVDGPWTLVATVPANQLTYRLAGLTSDAPVCVRIVAVSAGGPAAASPPDCTAPPASPVDLTATAVDGQSVNVAWSDRSTTEDGYEVQRSRDGYSWSVVATLSASTTSYLDGGLIPDTRYVYRVRPLKDGGFGDFSNADDAVTPGSAPLAPSSVQASPAGSTIVLISWSSSSPSVTDFRVERSGPDQTSWVTVPSDPWYTYQLYDYGRDAEQQVCYRVFARNAVGESPPSPVDCTTPPAAPTNFEASSTEAGTVDLTWQDNSPTNELYIVERYVSGYYYYYYEQVAVLDGSATSYRDSGLAPGQYYAYRVVAASDGGYSDYTGDYWVQVSGTPPE